MAKIYHEKLSNLITKLKLEADTDLELETKHFFSGVALYVNKTICVSWSPVGIAFKLPEKNIIKLISTGKAKELRYFPKGHIKKGYVLFEDADEKPPSYWKKYFLLAFKQT